MKLVDSHVHLFSEDGIDNLKSARERTGAERMAIASIVHREQVNLNTAAFAAKSAYPDRFYVFAALDHSQLWTSGRVTTPSLAEQVDRAVAIGADGIKLLETKPDRRKFVDVPIDSDYYEAFFARVEEFGLPLIWHVADPPEFWDPELTPKWALARGWGYDGTFIRYERLYSEVANVLKRHPMLNVIFAHFLFMSKDLAAVSELFDAYPGVHFDLSPGIELIYNLSMDARASSAFFERYADRIIFGTDIFSTLTLDEAAKRSGLVLRWLTTADEFRVPDGADFLLGPPEDGLIRGLDLPGDVLEKMLHANFEGLVGPEPRSLNAALAAEESARIAGLLGRM